MVETVGRTKVKRHIQVMLRLGNRFSIRTNMNDNIDLRWGMANLVLEDIKEIPVFSNFSF